MADDLRFGTIWRHLSKISLRSSDKTSQFSISGRPLDAIKKSLNFLIILNYLQQKSYVGKNLTARIGGSLKYGGNPVTISIIMIPSDHISTLLSYGSLLIISLAIQ